MVQTRKYTTLLGHYAIPQRQAGHGGALGGRACERSSLLFTILPVLGFLRSNQENKKVSITDILMFLRARVIAHYH